MKKTLGIAALLMAMLLLLTACGNSIEGTWELIGGTDQETAEMKAAGITMTLTFKSGKLTSRMELMGQSESNESTYTVSGNKITITSDGNTSEGEFKIDGKKLTLTFDGTSMTFEKK